MKVTVIAGGHAMKLLKKNRRPRVPATPPGYYSSLEFRLCELLSAYCGERGFSEGAEGTLARIIGERNRAFQRLALLQIQGPL